jgi:hypothetical protein
MSEQMVVRGGPDWWSRLMALGSLIVAGAALYYSYTLDPSHRLALKPATPQNESVAGDPSAASSTPGESTPGDGDDSVAQDRYAQSSLVEWDSPQESANRDSAESNNSANRSMGIADETISDPVANLQDEKSSDASDLDDELLDTPIEPPVEKTSNLAEVRTTFRPNGHPESITTVIRNTGQGAAQITGIFFRPTEIVELAIEASSPDWGPPDESQLIVMFDESENQSTTPGKHGDYFRDLSLPFTVKAGDTANINLAIKNLEHKGYGLRGRLTIRVRNGDDFDVDAVTLAFIRS